MSVAEITPHSDTTRRPGPNARCVSGRQKRRKQAWSRDNATTTATEKLNTGRCADGLSAGGGGRSEAFFRRKKETVECRVHFPAGWAEQVDRCEHANRWVPMLLLTFISYGAIFHTNSCEPTVAPPCRPALVASLPRLQEGAGREEVSHTPQVTVYEASLDPTSQLHPACWALALPFHQQELSAPTTLSKLAFHPHR